MNKTPAIILVGAQLGENIGTTARAMLNFGLTDLRLVAPREGWDKARAAKAAAGADALITNAKIFTNTEDAIADLSYVIASTARLRDMVKPVLTPPQVAQEIHARATQSENNKSGILFGREKSGLDNDDISLADVICRVPLNPEFSSLNLAQAVMLFCYEWHRTNNAPADSALLPTQLEHTPATRAELIGLFTHLQSALTAAGFLSPPEKAPAMMRNLRNMLHRAQMTEQDVRSFRGVINALLRFPRDEGDASTKARISAIARGDLTEDEQNIDIDN